MAKRSRAAPPFPRDLLDEVAWSFIDPPFATQAAFVEAVRAYERETRLEGEDESPWRPDEVVLWAPRVRIICEYWDDPEHLTKGVTFDEETGNLQTDLTADGAEGFTSAELLFKIHNAFANYLGEGDHHFFEGLHLCGRKHNANAPPVYEVYTGS
jgi:hypothetical protein